ncbi:hypothetical protein IscW_ISCW006302 [Ixodes scapularis]|uniref:Uncharacterized protein n=2 Tax=Ixodes scapularis TaxID=6945 RepID=B7PLH2_IXOSC|nr:hypothetical protein IscW_ISCW006302 [Ixodes scapularis]|eukprot:XP_002434620.1 hypothetical protein IscW_ISCW006302 [Ixodes scapularis]
MSLKLESPDKQVVQVIMKKPVSAQPPSGDRGLVVGVADREQGGAPGPVSTALIEEPLEGLLEVVGEVTAKLAVVCHSYVLFPPGMSQGFGECLQARMSTTVSTPEE